MGNKAINFLEWYQKGEISVEDNNSDGLAELQLKQSAKRDEVASFYSQPFKPEMITELFEGWLDKVREDEEYVFYKVDVNSYSNPEICFPSKGIELMVVRIDNSYSYFKIPKTLDSFKTLIEEQAGINLEWKQEIINKYFK